MASEITQFVDRVSRLLHKHRSEFSSKIQVAMVRKREKVKKPNVLFDAGQCTVRVVSQNT